MTKNSQISQMIRYLKNPTMKNRRPTGHERQDLLDLKAQHRNRASPHLTKGPKKIRLQLGINNTMLKDPLEISALLTAKTKQSTHTKTDLSMKDPAQSVHNKAAQNFTDSTSSKIPTPDPYLPYETMPKTLMKALCGKESEHWKKAWGFEMYRATLKQTWEDVEEEEFTVSDTADLANSFKTQIPKGVFRKTIRPNGTIKCRVRLVARGYSQI